MPVGKPLRILHVVPSYLPAVRYGGPIYSVHGLCKALVSLGHMVEVFTTNVDGEGESPVPIGQAVRMDGVSVTYFNSTWLRRLFHSRALRNALESKVKDFDIVHLHSVFLLPTLYAARAARKAGVPYLLSPRGMLNDQLIRRKSRWVKTAWIWLFEKKTVEYAAGLHVTSEVEGEALANFKFKLPPLFFVPNGIEEIDLNPISRMQSNVVPDYPYVLFLSRLNWKKGLDRLVRAWRHVTDTTLLIAGNDEDNYRAEIEKLAQLEGVDERIRFMGPVHGDDKWKLYENAKIFVLPSHSENFGNVALEAMAMGCPVIVTPEVGLSWVIEQNRCGIVTSGDPQSLATDIVWLLENPSERKIFGLNAKKTAHDLYSWPRVAQTMEQAYEAMLHTHSEM